MLVFGDAPRCEDTRAKLAGLDALLRKAGTAAPGLPRRATLVTALVEAGELLQGLADAEFAVRGEDAPSPVQDAAQSLLLGIAAVLRDARCGERTPAGDTAALAALPLPGSIAPKTGEGFAFYALYPEAYLEAAAGLPDDLPWRVIGLRSIGAPLAACVAAALDAPFVTVRPVGHPFRRELRVSAALALRVLDGAARFAVVDEGPGLSGSSLNAVVDWLEARGVARDRIHLFPGHDGAPGAQAAPEHRSRWPELRRHVVPFERAVLPELPGWVADLTGPAEAPLRDLSGGAWRAFRYASEAEWPPVQAWSERRKFFHRAGGRNWLLRFAGLGRVGERRLARARALAAAGLAPPVAGLRHGFLVEEWLDGASPPDPARPDLATAVGRYLEFRAAAFPAGPDSGAGMGALWEMARHNAGERLGASAAARLDFWQPLLPELDARVRRIETDNRLQRWEWLALPDGRLLKADALDHHAGHDLVGCQDLAWDVAGAEFELGIAPERLGLPVDPALLAFLRPCYLAFRLGAQRMAADSMAGWPAEAARLAASAEGYAQRLREVLEQDGTATPRL